MVKRRILLTVCTLCMLAALLLLPALAYTQRSVVLADEATNAILKSDDHSTPDTELEWTYGDDDVISYTFRPEHGDTAFYTVTKNNQEIDKFAVKYIGDTAILYEVKDDPADAADTEKPFRVNSLNAYLKTLTAGSYSLSVSVPSGTAAANHEHWWESGTCDVTAYSATTWTVNLIKVNAYELDEDNVGENTPTATEPIRYSILNPEMHYTGEANNVPKIDLVFVTSDGTRVLTEGEDYTLSSTSVNRGAAELTINGIGGFTGSVTIENAYGIVQTENTVSDVFVTRWKYGEYDKNVNRFTADANWGEDDLYFSITTEIITNSAQAAFVDGLDEIHLDDEGLVSSQVAELLNKLDAKKTYYLYATVPGNNNYYLARAYTPFDVVEVTNTWKTIPNVVSWEWHGFDENVNVINAVPAFGDSVKFAIYTKDGDEYKALKFGGKDSFELEEGEDGKKLPANVASVLAELDAGTYYLFASVVSDTVNYSSINEEYSADALVPFRVFQARNYWTQIPKISNWVYGEYNDEINVITAVSAHGASNISCSIYRQSADGADLLKFGDISSFNVNAVPKVVYDGFKALGVGKYYLRAEVEESKNYTGIKQVFSDFSELPSFEVIKAANYWSTAPAINAWAEGKYSNDDNLPAAAAHFGAARIVIVDVNDEENVLYDSEKNINNLSQAKVGAYLLTATVEGTDNYSALTFDTIFRVFVPETDKSGIPWWLVLIIVVCSLGVLVFIFWLLHDKGVLQMLTSKTVVAMRAKATMDATIAAVRANKVAEEAKESVRLAEELERLEAEKAETEENDSDEEGEAIMLERDEATGFATYVRYQRPFSVKLIQATDEAKGYYSRLKNVLLSYKKVKSKVSNGYDAFNRGRAQLAKLVIRGKTLCLYLALNPDHFADTKYKVERSESKKFADVPCLYRIKNDRRLGYAEDLIRVLCEGLEIVKGETQDIDYRPPYESTEDLLEKGLIKKVVYKRKISAPANDNQSAGADADTGSAPDLAQQEAAAAAEQKSAKTENEQAQPEVVPEQAPAATEESAAPEKEAAATEEASPSAENNADSDSGNKTHKKQQGAKKHVAKK